MIIHISPNDRGITAMDVAPDVGAYALVTIDGASAGTYSILAVGDTWDDGAVKAALLAWFDVQEAV